MWVGSGKIPRSGEDVVCETIGCGCGPVFIWVKVVFSGKAVGLKQIALAVN